MLQGSDAWLPLTRRLRQTVTGLQRLTKDAFSLKAGTVVPDSPK